MTAGKLNYPSVKLTVPILDLMLLLGFWHSAPVSVGSSSSSQASPACHTGALRSCDVGDSAVHGQVDGMHFHRHCRLGLGLLECNPRVSWAGLIWWQYIRLRTAGLRFNTEMLWLSTVHFWKKKIGGWNFHRDSTLWLPGSAATLNL